MHVILLTDDGAALAVSRELIIEDDEEHGEAEDQSDLETIAFATCDWQGEADDISQDDKNAWQH